MDVMSILHLIADGVIETVIMVLLIAGGIITTVGLVGTIVPFIDKFQVLAIQVIGVLLLCAGIFFKAGHVVEEHWQAKVQEAEKKVAEAEAKSGAVTVETRTVYVDRVKEVKVYIDSAKKTIAENQTKINQECATIDPAAIAAMNTAATGKKP